VKYFIGVMSGNSLDAVDVVVVNFIGAKFNIVAAKSFPICSDLKMKTLNITQSSTINDFIELDYKFADLFSNCIIDILKEYKVDKKDIIAIGSHGQTLLHGPDSAFPHSYQVGDPNIIATRTGIQTIGDFRRKDIALGGQGAPLAPIFHNYAFSSKDRDTFIVNIGGIANITYLKDGVIKAGFDTGPGNLLIDSWVRQNFAKEFDNNGCLARSGVLCQDSLDIMLRDDYFKLGIPKSTGRDYFNYSWALINRIDGISKVDMLTTLTHLTAITISQDIKNIASCGQIFLCGGGSMNKFLVELIRGYCNSCDVQLTDSVGVSQKWVESTLFAYLAKQHVDGVFLDMQNITGAKLPYQPGVSFSPPIV
jgi:anhydro-N-acetylmuramic acid kinase